MTAPELTRPVSAERPPPAFTVEATPAECAALARRFNIPEVLALTCRFSLRTQGTAVLAKGELAADVVQSCVVTLEPVPQTVREAFAVRFVPAGEVTDEDDPDAPDELPYSGGRIDLGEAAAEQLALALDPYPRSPDAIPDLAGHDGSREDADAAPGTPFAALGRLPRGH